MRTPASGGGRCQLAGRAGNDDTRDTSSEVAQCVARLPGLSLGAALDHCDAAGLCALRAGVRGRCD